MLIAAGNREAGAPIFAEYLNISTRFWLVRRSTRVPRFKM